MANLVFLSFFGEAEEDLCDCLEHSHDFAEVLLCVDEVVVRAQKKIQHFVYLRFVLVELECHEFLDILFILLVR